MNTVNNTQIMYRQAIEVKGEMKDLLKDTGDKIKDTLVKVQADGTQTIVPPCDFRAFPNLLDSEINTATALVVKPSFWQAMLFVIIGWVTLASFVGDMLGLSGDDYFVGYFIILFSGVVHYVDALYKRSKQTKALAGIRTKLMQEYINNSPSY